MIKKLSVVAGLASTLMFGCSSDEDPKKQAGEACSVDADCATGLVCRGQVCVGSDVTPDMGGDGTNNTNNANNENNQNNVQDEDYIVTYILEADNNREMFAVDTSTGESSKVHDDSISCNLGCWVSEDLAWFVYAQQNGPNFDILKVPMTNLLASGAGETVATAVRRAEVLGDVVTYVREDNNENVAFFVSLEGGAETRVGSIGSVQATEGDWFVDPETSKAVVYNATLQTLDVKIGDLGQDVTDTTFTIDSQNFQEVSGSYFGGNIATAISPDGSYMALITQSAPMDYNACQNDSECTEGAGQICGRFDRCSAIELVAHFFDLNALSNLGEACSADDTCGPVHTCDIPAADQVDRAKCIPRRVVLGLPGEQTQGNPQTTGCQISDGLDDYYYSVLRAPISFAPNGDLYMVGSRECDGVPDTAILKLSPESNDIDVAFGRLGGYNPDNCFDATEQKIDETDCAPYIQQAEVSPGGNEVVFIGTNPNVIDPALAASNVDLWTVKRNGEDRRWLGQHPELDRVKSFSVHEK